MTPQAIDEASRQTNIRREVDSLEQHAQSKREAKSSESNKLLRIDKSHPGHTPAPPERACNKIPDQDYPTSPFPE
jgi:hypothetical protein